MKNYLEMNKNILINRIKNIRNDNFLNIFKIVYIDLNNLIGKDLNIEKCIAYFTARIMNYFLDYTLKNKKIINGKKRKYLWG